MRHAGPYAVVERVGTHAYRLQLPETMKIHDVFHISLLRPYHAPTYPGQATTVPGPVEVDSEGTVRGSQYHQLKEQRPYWSATVPGRMARVRGDRRTYELGAEG